MKNHFELAYLFLLLIALVVHTPAVSNFKKTVLGKLVLVVGIICMSLCNRVYGLVAAFLTVCLLQNVREGMTHKSDDNEQDEQDEQDEEEETEEKEDNTVEAMTGEESEEKSDNNDEHDKDGDEHEPEGFTLMSGGSAFQTSSMDRLAADEMLKSKPSHMFPVNDVERRGQDKSVTDSVFSSIRKLFG